VDKRRREFVAADKPPIVAKFLFDKFMVKNSESDGCFADPAGANEGGGSVGSDESEDLIDELVPSEEQSWSRRRRFTKVSMAPYQCTSRNLIEKPQTRPSRGTKSITPNPHGSKFNLLV